MGERRNFLRAKSPLSGIYTTKNQAANRCKERLLIAIQLSPSGKESRSSVGVGISLIRLVSSPISSSPGADAL